VVTCVGRINLILRFSPQGDALISYWTKKYIVFRINSILEPWVFHTSALLCVWWQWWSYWWGEWLQVNPTISHKREKIWCSCCSISGIVKALICQVSLDRYIYKIKITYLLLKKFKVVGYVRYEIKYHTVRLP
jgi:hypothetical protein